MAGASHGLVLMDGSTSVGVNNRIYARESGNGPYLDVMTSREDHTAPAGPTNVKVAPAPNWAWGELGAIELSFTVPERAFAYRVKVNGQSVDRWQIPFAGKSGQTQSFPIADLPPDADVKVEICAVDSAGNESPYVVASGKASPKLTVPALPASPFQPQAGEPKSLGEAKVWAFPEITKLSPTSGEIIGEKLAGDIRQKNAVWDGASGTIRLAAARGEIVSFQLAVEGQIKQCRVSASSLKGPQEISSTSAKLWRNWYVQGQSEYALPLKDTFDCPAEDNKIAGQKLQAITVDYHIPQTAPAGDYAASVRLSAGAATVELPLKIKVYDVVIPDEIHFNPELNCYGGPGEAGSAQFTDSFRLAHYHRCTINRVPYSQSGNVHGDWAPKVDATGHVTDWSSFDANLGGLLDGAAFKDNPRAGVPVPTLYLPLFEGWPLNFRQHYNPGEGVPVNGKDDNQKLRHDVLAKPIEQAMDQAFKDAWVNCTADFVKHFNDKGWNKTIAECYLNDKPNFGYTLWTLDEPFEYLDWAALNLFGKLWKQAVNDPQVYTAQWHDDYFRKGLAGMNRGRPTFLFRGDISRLPWQGSVSDGLMNIVYLGGGGFEMPRMVRYAKSRMPSLMYAYGACNNPDRGNWESAAWCLKAYANESDGVLPWQSLAGAGAMQKLDECALVVNAGAYGDAVASFRVHALRRARRTANSCDCFS